MVLTELILTVSTLGGCGGLERKLNFNSFYFCRCVVALKELIFNSFYFGGAVIALKGTDF